MPLLHVDRYIRETNELFDDGSHTIYMNGNYKGNDEIGQLMKDFHQTAPENLLLFYLIYLSILSGVSSLRAVIVP